MLLSPAQISKLKDTKWGQEIFENLPKYFKENLKLKALDNTDKLFKRSSTELDRLGAEIGDTALKIDGLADKLRVLPTRSKIANRVQKSLYELRDQIGKSPDLKSKKALKKIDKRIASWDDWLAKDDIISAVETKELKTTLQQAARWGKKIDQVPLEGKMDRTIAEAVRQEFLDIADSVAPFDKNLGQKLRQLNLDYGTSLLVTDKLRRAVDKEASKEGGC